MDLKNQTIMFHYTIIVPKKIGLKNWKLCILFLQNNQILFGCF
jgi:hypothetical protein